MCPSIFPHTVARRGFGLRRAVTYEKVKEGMPLEEAIREANDETVGLLGIECLERYPEGEAESCTR